MIDKEIRSQFNNLSEDIADVNSSLSGQIAFLSADLEQTLREVENKIFMLDASMRFVANPLWEAIAKVRQIEENINGMRIGWPFRNIISPDGAITIEELELNFRIKPDSGTSVKVYGGIWERNGNRIAMTVDAGEAYKTLTGLSSDGTYYIYLQFADSTEDPSIIPDTLTVEASLSLPDNTSAINIYWILGTVVVSSGVIIADGITQLWYGGNIYDTFDLPDSNSNYDASSDKRNYSLEQTTRAGRHNGTWQDYDWNDAASSTPSGEDDFLLYRDVLGSGADTYYQKKYVSIQTLGGVITQYLSGWTSGVADAIAVLLNQYSYIHHTDLDFTNTGSGWAAKGTGKSGGNTDHDDSYWHSFNDGAADSFVDAKDYHTTGEVRADDLYIQDATTNLWNAAGFDVSVSDDISLTATNDIAMTAGTASTWNFTDKLDMNIGAASTWTTAGTFYFYNGVAGTRTVIESMADQLFFFPNNAGTTTLWLGGGDPYAWSLIKYNGVAGVDITNWTTKGGLTGATLVTKKVSQLADDDEVLVRPA